MGWMVNATPRPIYPTGNNILYPLTRSLGGPQSHSGLFLEKRKISSNPYGDSNSVRPTHYCDFQKLSVECNLWELLCPRIANLNMSRTVTMILNRKTGKVGP